MTKVSKEITPELVQYVYEKMGDEGLEFFRAMLKMSGQLDPVLESPAGPPYPVHFREGMRVRNIMRESGLCDDWSDHDFDDLWRRVVGHVLFYSTQESS